MISLSDRIASLSRFVCSHLSATLCSRIFVSNVTFSTVLPFDVLRRGYPVPPALDWQLPPFLATQRTLNSKCDMFVSVNLAVKSCSGVLTYTLPGSEIYQFAFDKQRQVEATKTVGVLMDGKARLETGLGEVMNSYR